MTLRLETASIMLVDNEYDDRLALAMIARVSVCIEFTDERKLCSSGNYKKPV